MEIKLSKRQRKRASEDIASMSFGILKCKGYKYEVCDIADLIVITDTFAYATDSNGSSKHDVIHLDDYIEKLKEPVVQEKTLLQKLMFWRKI